MSRINASINHAIYLEHVEIRSSKFNGLLIRQNGLQNCFLIQQHLCLEIIQGSMAKHFVRISPTTLLLTKRSIFVILNSKQGLFNRLNWEVKNELPVIREEAQRDILKITTSILFELTQPINLKQSDNLFKLF